MNKKGFTLTELLVVIALISIIVLIAVPSVVSISKRINKRGRTTNIYKRMWNTGRRIYGKGWYVVRKSFWRPMYNSKS